MFTKSDLKTNINQIEIPFEGRQLSLYPNPFSEQLTISTSIDKGGIVYVNVYDIMGRLVKTVCDSYLHPGQHEFIWRGRDNIDNTANKGIYLISFIDKQKSETRIVNFIK